MALNEKFRTRFVELNESFKSMPYEYGEFDGVGWVPDGQWQKWATSSQNLILATFGATSPHYDNFCKAYQTCSGSAHHVKALYAIFSSAREDFDGGYVFDVDLRISGEVFGDLVALAKQAMSGGHRNVAAVLASAALEDALKRYSAINGVDVKQKTMQEVINAMKSKGLVQGAQKTLLDAMPRIRNFSLHADWDKLSDPDVSSVIGFVEQFLLSKFSA